VACNRRTDTQMNRHVTTAKPALCRAFADAERCAGNDANNRTERPRKTKIGTEAHVTRDSGHYFQGQQVKGQGHQAALLTTMLARQAAAVVGV